MKKLLLLGISLLLFVNVMAKDVVVGAKMFTEGYVVSNLISELLKKDGFNVKENFGMSSFPLRKAQETGQIDIYPEYTGTAWGAYFKKKELIKNPKKLYEEVKKLDYQKNKLVWLDMINVNNTYALAIRKDFAKKYNLKSLTDLANLIKVNKKIKFGINPEFYKRADGFWAMAKHYKMKIKRNEVKLMDAGIVYQAVASKKIDVAMAYSTDAKIKKYNLKVLKDDSSFFPYYNLAVVVREETLKKYPEIREDLKVLSDKLTEEDLIDLNYKVDVEGKEPKEVAKWYLKNKM
ncbi:ABC transporter substrate-binding protein [Haliovirga abyssi]|uniref:ABC-type glycine betaine transport system substrate-binding domain-containing protein n=1 Tax=Haliovirga abyssi TaxID=2996794 RepID=A0AAU9D156_9FUSO|nr:glycine betaine ABC transporter substrate-binding protein [Haliovirga abyssi]BDU49706.1 hypothetical protein HLVA_02750 [Haliovirga abyssi]